MLLQCFQDLISQNLIKKRKIHADGYSVSDYSLAHILTDEGVSEEEFEKKKVCTIKQSMKHYRK